MSLLIDQPSTIFDYIARGDFDSIAEEINKINVDHLPTEKWFNLALNVIAMAYQANQRVILYRVIDMLEPNYADEYQLPLLHRLLKSYRLSDEHANFLLRAFPNRSYLELASGYLRRENDNDDMTGFDRLEMYYGPQEEKTYRFLYEFAFAQGHSYGREYFGNKLDQAASFAPIPAWIIPSDLREKDITLPELKARQYNYDLTEDNIIKILTSGLRQSGISNTEVEAERRRLRQKLQLISREEKNNLIRQALNHYNFLNLARDEKIFQLFGPAHAKFGIANDEGDICSDYGGCRMLCCPGTTEDETEEDEWWFTGACQVCHLRIRRYPHAVRRPLNYGGWEGCYCSEECLRQNLACDPLTDLHVTKLFEELNRWGILDRE